MLSIGKHPHLYCFLLIFVLLCAKANHSKKMGGREENFLQLLYGGGRGMLFQKKTKRHGGSQGGNGETPQISSPGVKLFC